jgi:hypothetical protein
LRSRLHTIGIMNCCTFEELLIDHLDGTLPKRQASLLSSHALQCRACRSLMGDIKEVIEDVKGVRETVEIPSHLENTLLRIQAEQTPLTCFAFEELITEFLDGFVPASVYHKFEHHAGACAPCSSLLTEVVYAVAACHSVHTYEEVEVSGTLVERLLAIQPQQKVSLRRKVAEKMAAFVGSLMPRATHSRGWSYATASGLAVAVFALLLFGFSEDRSVSGIYREARATAYSLYSQSTDLYSQKDELIAGLEKVRSDIGEVWNAIGGASEAEASGRAAEQKLQAPKPDGNRNTGGAGFSVIGR